MLIERATISDVEEILALQKFAYHLYQKLGYRIFKTAKITDQTNIAYLEKKGEPRGLRSV